MTIRMKRVYEDAAQNDGYRVLIDRIWPRGVSKDEAALDAWIKDLAPSTELRKWFNHVPERWDGFRERYEAELAGNAAAQEALQDLRRRAHKHTVTLVFASRETRYNNAVFLKSLLDGK